MYYFLLLKRDKKEKYILNIRKHMTAAIIKNKSVKQLHLLPYCIPLDPNPSAGMFFVMFTQDDKHKTC